MSRRPPTWLAMGAVLFLGLIALPKPGRAQVLAPLPEPGRAWLVLQDYTTRPVDELRPGWAYTHQALSGLPVLACTSGEGCYLVVALKRCAAGDASPCGPQGGTLLTLGGRATPLPPGVQLEDPPPPPPPPLHDRERPDPSPVPVPSAAARPAPRPLWIDPRHENRWGWELSLGGTLGVGLGSGPSLDGTSSQGAWLVAGGMFSIGVRQGHAFRQGIGLRGLFKRLWLLAYLPPFILGAVPPSAWVGNYVGFDLRVRVLPHVRLLTSSEPTGWPSGRLTVGLAPALYAIAQERLRFPSVLQMLIPEFGVSLPFGPAAEPYLGFHFPGIPFAALLSPRVGIELEPKTLVFFPLDGSPYELQLLATLSLIVR